LIMTKKLFLISIEKMLKIKYNLDKEYKVNI